MHLSTESRGYSLQTFERAGQGTEGMLRNPYYLFCLMAAFILGFAAVLVLPVGGPDMRGTIAMQTQTQNSGPQIAGLDPGGSSAHAKTSAPVFLASRDQPAISSALPREEIESYSRAYTAPSKWSVPSLTKLVALESSPFPYRGSEPRTSTPFLNFKDGVRKGRMTRSGRVYWEDKTYSDPRVLLHIPRGFDARKPGVIVLFFHGHGATLARDVVPRQRLPEQISNSGLNAVLVAPQFAVDARDSSAGNFWKPGGTRRFLNEVAPQLAKLLGDQNAKDIFASMPVVIVGYSGGYVPAAWTLANGGIENRVKGVVLLDGLYSELAKFAKWIERKNSSFFLSAYANSTRKGNAKLQRMLKQRGIAYTTKLDSTLKPGSVTFLKAVEGHRDYVTRAWAENPVSDLLARIPGIAPRVMPARSASLQPGLIN